MKTFESGDLGEWGVLIKIWKYVKYHTDVCKELYRKSV